MITNSVRIGKDFGHYFSTKKWLSQSHMIMNNPGTCPTDHPWKDLSFGTLECSYQWFFRVFIVGKFSSLRTLVEFTPQNSTLLRRLKTPFELWGRGLQGMEKEVIRNSQQSWGGITEWQGILSISFSSSWILVWLVSAVPQWELLLSFFFFFLSFLSF